MNEFDVRIGGDWEVGQDPILGEEPAIAEACGLERLHVSLHDRGTEFVYGDGWDDPELYFVVHQRFDLVFTNPDTGGQFFVEFRDKARYNPPVSEVFDPETQTLTLEFEDDFRGLEYRLRAKGLGVIAMDAGHGTIGVTVVVDFSTDPPTEVLSFDVEQRGRFTWGGPDGSPDPRELDLICRALDGSRGRGR